MLVAAVLLASLIGAPAWSQSPAPAPIPEPSSAPVRPLADGALLAQLRAGGLVIYFRHTATDFSRDDRAMRDFDDCDSQRPLTAKGRTDATAIGAHFKRLAIPVGRVLASPYGRTREVAERMFGRYERADAVRGGPADASGERYAGLKTLLSTPPAAGTNLVISSHANPMRAVAGPPYLAEGEAVVIRPLGQSGFEIIARIPLEQWGSYPAPRERQRP